MRLLKARGYFVIIQKFDPYLNTDPGTMNPYQHGEVFVTEGGAETDLDLGHYERFADVFLTRYIPVTSGQVYFSALQRERGGYDGGTVQVISHITDEIKSQIRRVAAGGDVMIGGTDIHVMAHKAGVQAAKALRTIEARAMRAVEG